MFLTTARSAFLGAFSAMLLALAVWALVSLDAAGQGLLVLLPSQARECRDGGGCAAYSRREAQALVENAILVGRQTCPR